MYRLSDSAVVEPRVTPQIFGAMISGLAAGVVAAAGIVVALGVVVSAPSGMIVSGFFAGVFFSMFILPTGALLAIFPIGPLWVLMAWIMVRRDVKSAWVYAAVGATAATGLPLLLPFWMLKVAAADFSGALDWLALFGWFAASGAIGGGYAGAGILALRGRSAGVV